MASVTERDWYAWHRDYDEPDTALARRLAAVQDQIRAALDAAPPGPLHAVSLCAGQGRDLIGVLARHPRRDDVTARLVELDPRNTAAARGTAATPVPLERGARMFTFTGHHPRTGPARRRPLRDFIPNGRAARPAHGNVVSAGPRESACMPPADSSVARQVLASRPACPADSGVASAGSREPACVPCGS